MKKEKQINLIILIFALISVSIFIFMISKLNLIPIKYLIPLFLMILIPFIFLMFKNMTGHKKRYKILLIGLSVLLLLPFPLLNQFSQLKKRILNSKTETQTVLALVLDETPYQTLEDVKGLVFAANTSIDALAIEQAQTQILEEGYAIHIQRHDAFNTLHESFFNQSAQVMLLNEDHMPLMESMDESFENRVRVLAKFTFEKELDDVSDTNTSKDTFSIYISGLDFAGDIEETQRSDANIVLTINPIHKQILMTSIPRDTFVVRHTNGQKDKLSLVGYSGIDETMKTIEDFLSMDIDYFLKVNWTSVVEVVDALGGIEVNSPYSFKSGKYSFQQGPTSLDGPRALAFVTHRMTLPDGEDSRAQNQQYVLEAILEKIMSPSIITNYTQFLEAISNNIRLSMPEKQLDNLIKDQLNTMSPWQIFRTQVIGDVFDTWDAYSLKGVYQVVKDPHPELLEQAKNIIEMMENNELITKDMFKH